MGQDNTMDRLLELIFENPGKRLQYRDLTKTEYLNHCTALPSAA